MTMARKIPANHGKSWTPARDRELRSLARSNTPTGLIAYKTQRTEDAVRSRASALHTSLKPVNRSPYSRRKG
jgi:hypothetical protein